MARTSSKHKHAKGEAALPPVASTSQLPLFEMSSQFKCSLFSDISHTLADGQSTAWSQELAIFSLWPSKSSSRLKRNGCKEGPIYAPGGDCVFTIVQCMVVRVQAETPTCSRKLPILATRMSRMDLRRMMCNTLQCLMSFPLWPITFPSSSGYANHSRCLRMWRALL